MKLSTAKWIYFFIALQTIFLSGKAQSSSSYPDTVVHWASLKYANKGVITRFLLGNNYRKELAMPVKMPVFSLATTNGGFTIEELGGGMETNSLRLKDSEGREWALRTIDKEVSKGLPKVLRHTLVETLMQEMISGANPYAPLSVSTLAKAAGVVAADPKLYYVKGDNAFGKYRDLFANKVCLLEQRDPTPGNSKTESTDKVLEEIVNTQNHLVNQHEVLKARLLDMLIADWDRHADQWRWGIKDSVHKTYYYAVPRDRDQAFFKSNGFLVKIARELGMPQLVNFKKNNLHVIKLSFKAWGFDQTFMNELNAADWLQAVHNFTTNITDSVIRKAVDQLPPEVYRLNGEIIKEKLISRRNKLLPHVMNYYRFLSRHVVVDGTNKADLFKISGDGTLLFVTVLTADKNADTLYFRKFDPKETRVITLNGLRGDDIFEMDESAVSNIKIKIYGSSGNDTYNMKGHTKNELYDYRREANEIKAKNKSKVHFEYAL